MLPDSTQAIAARPGEWVFACAHSAFDQKDIVTAQFGSRSIIIIRDQQGALFAVNRACPHQAADLAKGRCSNGKLMCPRHMAWFDLQDGTAKGWFVDPLRRYSVRNCEDGVYVFLDLTCSRPRDEA